MRTPQARMVMLALAVLSFVVGSVWELGGFLVYVLPGLLFFGWVVLNVLAIVSVEVADSVKTHRDHRRADKLLSKVSFDAKPVVKDLSHYTGPPTHLPLPGRDK